MYWCGIGLIFTNACRVASYSEWKALYMLCKDENGVLQKDTIRAVYDGSLFQQMAKDKAASKPN